MKTQDNMATAASSGPYEAAEFEGPGNGPEKPSIFHYIWRVFWTNRLIVGAIIIAAVAIALVLTLLATPQYTSTSRIQINRIEANVSDVEGVEPAGDGLNYDEFYRTQYALLESEALAERVARKLNLPADEAFIDAFDIPDDGEIRSGNQRLAMERTSLLLLELISIEPVVGSSLADVSFTSPSPELSRRIASTWISEFVAASMERRFAATDDARKFLEQQLAELRSRLEDSERSFVTYSSQSGIVSLSNSEATTGNDRTLKASDLASMNDALNSARADRIAAESALQAGVQQQGNTVANTLRAKRAELAAQKANLLTQFEPGYPRVEALTNEIAELDRSIADALGTGQADLRRNLMQAQQREQALQAQVEGLRSVYNDEQRATVQYNILKRDVDTNRELYNSLLQRYKEIGVAGAAASNVQLVDPARIPREPSSPNLPLNLALGFLLGIGVSGAVLFAREEMDRSVRDPQDVRQKLNIALLGVIPKTDAEDPLDELADAKSAISEAYLSAGVLLDMSTSEGFPKTLMLTSTVPSEGKTSSSYALAHRLARSGHKTILVDLDLRNPSVAKRLGVPNERGVVEFLTGQDALSTLVQRDVGPNFDILSVGAIPPNPGQLIAGPKIGELLTQLRNAYDFVVIDAPPVLGIADAPVLGSQVEGIVYIIEANRAGVRQLSSAIERMRSMGGRILGGILTKVDERNTDYGYGSEYGYGYGYGQSSDDDKL